MPTYCIICGKEKAGIPVADDRILETLRWFKRNVTHNEQKNKLVVCKEDYPLYKKNRDKYMFRTVIYLIIGALFMLLGILIAPSLGSVLAGGAVLLFLYLLSLLNYTPKLQIEPKNEKQKKHNQ